MSAPCSPLVRPDGAGSGARCRRRRPAPPLGSVVGGVGLGSGGGGVVPGRGGTARRGGGPGGGSRGGLEGAVFVLRAPSVSSSAAGTAGRAPRLACRRACRAPSSAACTRRDRLPAGPGPPPVRGSRTRDAAAALAAKCGSDGSKVVHKPEAQLQACLVAAGTSGRGGSGGYGEDGPLHLRRTSVRIASAHDTAATVRGSGLNRTGSNHVGRSHRRTDCSACLAPA